MDTELPCATHCPLLCLLYMPLVEALFCKNNWWCTQNLNHFQNVYQCVIWHSACQVWVQIWVMELIDACTHSNMINDLINLYSICPVFEDFCVLVESLISLLGLIYTLGDTSWIAAYVALCTCTRWCMYPGASNALQAQEYLLLGQSTQGGPMYTLYTCKCPIRTVRYT